MNESMNVAFQQFVVCNIYLGMFVQKAHSVFWHTCGSRRERECRPGTFWQKLQKVKVAEVAMRTAKLNLVCHKSSERCCFCQ